MGLRDSWAKKNPEENLSAAEHKEDTQDKTL